MQKSEFYCSLPTSPDLGRAKTPSTMTSNHLSQIPVPKSPRSLSAPNKSSLYSLTKRVNNSNSNNQGPIVSVAAHLASFERLDSVANNTKRNYNNDNNISKVQRPMYSTNSQLNTANNNNGSYENNWKNQQRKIDPKRQIFGKKIDNGNTCKIIFYKHKKF